MSTIVYRGLPSFLDTQLNESRTLRLKLSSPRSQSHIPHSLEIAICTVFDSECTTLLKENGDIIKQKLLNPSTEPSSNFAYVHPLVKRASNALSDKSLEICTENLGSETGTDDVIEDENVVFSVTKKHSRKMNVSSSRRMLPKKRFPPPLSTMMGSETVQVRAVRENGRLILRAVKVQPKASCFHVDRSSGRLRLRFVDAENSSGSNLSAMFGV